MRIRKRAPHAAEATTGAKELEAVQQLSFAAELGSLSSRGGSLKGPALDDVRSRNFVAEAFQPGTSCKYADGSENVAAQPEVEEEARRTSQPVDDRISPVSTEFSSTLGTCTRSLESNGGGQDHRISRNAIHPVEERLNSSMVHNILGNNTKGDRSGGGKSASSILNISSNLAVSETLDAADRAAAGTSDCSVLFQSLVNVFERAGRNGLTASEAVSQIVEQGLPGLEEGSPKRFTTQVAKALHSPCFVQLAPSGRFFLYHFVSSEAAGPDHKLQDLELPRNGLFLQRDLSRVEDDGKSCAMLKKGRTKLRDPGHTAAAAAAVFSVNLIDTEAEGGTPPPTRQEESCAQDVIEFRKRRRRAPASQRELAIGPTQCKRYDGRGWQCTRKTEEGYSFCEHHQALINKRAVRAKLGMNLQSCTTGQKNLRTSGTAVQLSTGSIPAKSLPDGVL